MSDTQGMSSAARADHSVGTPALRLTCPTSATSFGADSQKRVYRLFDNSCDAQFPALNRVRYTPRVTIWRGQLSARRFHEVLYAQGAIRMPDSDVSQPSKILIADDNEQNCELLEAYLAGEDYDIAMAFDGQETIDKVSEFHPDIILLDIMMPRMSGYEVCEQLKKDPATAGIPILMVTALNEMGDIEKAVNAGCDDFLTKPVNRLELTTRVKSLLRVRHLTNERDRLLAYLREVDRNESQPGVFDGDSNSDESDDEDSSADDDSVENN
jgi:two-component system alkaline phosphatase synthesis response regulator PhoP